MGWRLAAEEMERKAQSQGRAARRHRLIVSREFQPPTGNTERILVGRREEAEAEKSKYARKCDTKDGDIVACNLEIFGLFCLLSLLSAFCFGITFISRADAIPNRDYERNVEIKKTKRNLQPLPFNGKIFANN